jgi:hypothetical protein
MLNLCGGCERVTFIPKKFKSKSESKQARGPAVAQSRPRPRPRPRRRRPWSGSSCRTARGAEWVVTVGSAGLPAAGPAGHRDGRPILSRSGPVRGTRGSIGAECQCRTNRG